MKNIILLLTFCWLLHCTKSLLEYSMTNDYFNQTKETPNRNQPEGSVCNRCLKTTLYLLFAANTEYIRHQ